MASRHGLICKIGLTFAVSLCFYLSSPIIWGLSVGVTPTRLELTGAPGEVISQYFDVVGEEKGNTRILSYLGDWTLDPNGQVQYMNPGENPRSATKWVKISPTDFPIPAGEKRRVQVTVEIPNDAEGEYWTMAYFEARSTSVLKTTGVNMAGRIGNAIYILVKKNVQRKAAVTGMVCYWSAEKGFVGQARFENRGNVRLFPKGRMEIRNMEGKTLATVGVESLQVLPGTARILAAKKALDLNAGTYVVLAVFDYDGEKLVAAQSTMKVTK